jgi:hypothetical protein
VFVNQSGSVSINNVGLVNNTTAGVYDVVASGAITVDGLISSVGTITLTGSSLTNNGTISNPAPTITPAVVLNADAFNLDGIPTASINAGAGSVVLRPRTPGKSFGIEANAAEVNITQEDINTITAAGFVVFGSGQAGTFTGAMTIGADAQVDGGTKNLGFFRSAGAAGTITVGANGVTTDGNLVLSTVDGSIESAGGPVEGTQVMLRAAGGIGTLANPVNTIVGTLAAQNTGSGGVFISQTVA